MVISIKYRTTEEFKPDYRTQFILDVFNKACYSKDEKRITDAIERMRLYGIEMEVAFYE